MRCQLVVGEEEELLNEGVHNREERMENVKGGHVAVEEVIRMEAEGLKLMAI